MNDGEPSERIGPGRLILVVGPSGAGKDTLIDIVRAACRDNSSIVFPRRVITRQSSAAEDHDTISDAAFDRAATDGVFALWWGAHKLKYGIPAAIDGDIRAGRTVVCNVSRAIVAQARQRFACVIVALVTAPHDILAARLLGRGRSSDGSVAERVQRAVAGESEMNPDVIIENIGTVESAAEKLLHAVLMENVEPEA